MNFRSLAKSPWIVVLGIFLLGLIAWPQHPVLIILDTIVAILIVIARLDDSRGTYLPLVVLFVVLLFVLVFLVGGLAVVHRLMSG